MTRRLQRRGLRLFAVCFGIATGFAGLRVAALADDTVHLIRPPATGGGAAEVSFPRRWYLGAGVGASWLEPRSPTSALDVGDESSGGGHLFLGYDLTRWLTTELYAADLGSAGIDFLDTDVGDVDYQVYGASLIGYVFNSQSGMSLGNLENGLFRREGLSLFGRVGIGGMRNDSDLDYERDYTAHLAVGAGLEYGFRNGFALRAEYMGFDTDAQYVGIGLLKRFGEVPAAAAAVPVAAKALPAEVAPTDEPTPLPALPPPVLFDFDKSELRPATRQALDELIASLPDGDYRLRVDGHADWIASEAYNQALSMRRANAVRAYLIDGGVDPDSLDVRAFGETRPIASNETAAGRQLNRRVEFSFR